MKIQILEQKRNPLLKRKELSVSLEHTGKATPSRKEMLPELAKALKSGQELLIIEKIFSVPGRNISRARVLAYSKKDDIPKEKLEKMKSRMMEKKAPAEAPKEEKPPEGEPPKNEDKPQEEGKEEEPPPEKPPEEHNPEDKEEKKD